MSKTTKYPLSKEFVCPICGRKGVATLSLDANRLKDGYHAGCSDGFCGYWYFLPLSKVKKVIEKAGE